MKCEEVHPLLDAYVDGELQQELGDAVSLHVSQCADCAAKVLALAKLGVAVRSALDEEPSGDLFPQIMARCRRKPGLLSRLYSVWRYPTRTALAGLTAVCVVLAAVSLYHPQRPAPRTAMQPQQESSSPVDEGDQASAVPQDLPAPDVLFPVPDAELAPADTSDEWSTASTKPTSDPVRPSSAAAPPKTNKRKTVRPVPGHNQPTNVRVDAQPSDTAPVLVVLAEPDMPAEGPDSTILGSFRLEFPDELSDQPSLRSLSVVKRVGPSGDVESLDISFTLPDALQPASDEREGSDDEQHRSDSGRTGSAVLVSTP
ncbi:MAG: zf-HC2 domain-containing protein [Armatimonadota bacterium]